MPVTTWSQNAFHRPNQIIQITDDSFFTATGLLPDPLKKELRPFLSPTNIPINLTTAANLADVSAVTYSATEPLYEIWGSLAVIDHHDPTTVAKIAQFDQNSNHASDINLTTTPLAKYKQNVVALNDTTYFINTTGEIHTTTGVFFSPPTGDEITTICTYGSRIFAGTKLGHIYRSNRAMTTMDLYYQYDTDQVIYITPYRQYILTITWNTKRNTINIYRLPDSYAQEIHHLATIYTPSYPNTTDTPQTQAFTLHNNELFFIIPSQNINNTLYTLYSFKEEHITPMASLTATNAAPYTVFIHSHHNTIIATSGTKLFALNPTEDAFSEIYEMTNYGASTGKQIIYHPCGDTAIITSENTGNEAIAWILKPGQIAAFTDTKELVTSWLQMQTPTTEKFLHAISVTLSVTGTTPTISYRRNYADTWVTAVSTTTGIHTETTRLKQQFTALQIKITYTPTIAAQGIKSITVTFDTPAT